MDHEPTAGPEEQGGCPETGPQGEEESSEPDPHDDVTGNSNPDTQQMDEQALNTILNLVSGNLAIQQSQTCCKVHEWCNGGCGDARAEQISYLPIVYGRAGLRMMMTPSATASFPEPAVAAEATAQPQKVDFDKLEKFTHTPLPTDGSMIRLIRVKPAVFIQDPLCIDILRVSRAECPKYAALSYHWGASVFDHSVVCNGKHLQITESLHKALLRHRQRQHREGECLIWADAVCIDQTPNCPELTSQLRIMGSIYSSSVRAIVDLGDVAVGDTRFSWYHGLDLMNKLATLHKFAPETKGIELRGREDLVHFGLPDEDHESWLLFGSLFARPWFGRTWIVQEFVLAPKVDCRYGQFTFPWNLLEDALLFLIEHDMFLHKCESNAMQIGKLNARRIMEMRQHRKDGAEDSSFLPPLHILHHTREFHATQPRDLILGTLGLLPPSSLFGEHGFVFDASWSAKKIYHRFASWLVWDARRLWGSWQRVEMLSYAGLSRRLPSPEGDDHCLPSWAPDWRAQSITVSPKPFWRLRETDYHAQPKDSMHVILPLDSGPIPECIVGETKEPRRILVRGWYFDRINSVTESTPLKFCATKHKTEGESYLSWYQQVTALLEQESSRLGHLPYDNVEDSLARTLLANDLNEGPNEVRGLTRITDPGALHALVLSKLKTPEASLCSVSMFKVAAANTFWCQMTTVCSQRKFAMTSKGYMAMVPDCAVAGDTVVVFAGVTIPFVVRMVDLQSVSDDDAGWLLVGEAYVHGIMEENETVDDFEESNQEAIILC